MTVRTVGQSAPSSLLWRMRGHKCRENESQNNDRGDRLGFRRQAGRYLAPQLVGQKLN